MNKFTINADNNYLKKTTIGYFHTYYTGYKTEGNPDYLNVLKNTFNSYSVKQLENAKAQLFEVMKQDLFKFNKNLAVVVIPRAKTEKTYHHNQLLFKKVTQAIIENLGFENGSDYIIRHTDTKTTHLTHSPKAVPYAGDGDMPYPGITLNTCKISSKISGKDILLIDDIYTTGINIIEDAIQALFENKASSIIFYGVAKTI